MKSRRSPLGGTIAIILAACLLSLLFAARSEAIPAFARKYETACSTCHVIYPKLNPYGEGFRNSGYRFLGRDEELVKKEDVPMGAEAWKHVFPQGIWPGALPGIPPLALRGAYGGAYYPDSEVSKTTFQTPWEASLYWGTTLGTHISSYGKVNLDGGGLYTGFVRFDSLFSGALGENTLNLRLGKIETANLPWSTTRFIGISIPLVYQTARNGVYTLSTNQKGMQVEGLFGHWVRYGVGLANGSSAFRDDNDAKDYFGRLAVKIGGMGFDGYNKKLAEGEEIPQTDNWTDNSATIGLFSYRGTEAVDRDVENDFSRQGVDLRLQFGDLDLFGMWIRETDDNPGGGGLEAEYDSWFAEADFVILPWMVALLRYESLGAEEEVGDQIRWVPGVAFAVRANVKVNIEAQLHKEDFRENVYQIMVDLGL